MKTTETTTKHGLFKKLIKSAWHDRDDADSEEAIDMDAQFLSQSALPAVGNRANILSRLIADADDAVLVAQLALADAFESGWTSPVDPLVDWQTFYDAIVTDWGSARTVEIVSNAHNAAIEAYEEEDRRPGFTPCECHHTCLLYLGALEEASGRAARPRRATEEAAQ